MELNQIGVTTSNPTLYNEDAAAKFLDVAPGTLTVWQSTGRYALPFIKVGRRVKYRLSDLEEFLEKRTRLQSEGI